MNKITSLVLAGSLVAATSASAAVESKNYAGVYAGVNAGYSTLSVPTFTKNLNGFQGGLQLGYGQMFGKTYAGGEIFANFGGGSYKNNNGTDVRARETLGLAARVGYDFGPMLGYVKLGYQSKKHNGTIVKTAANVTTTTKGGFLNRGFLLGLGAETFVAKNVTVGAEYTHAFYKDKMKGDEFKLRVAYKF